MSLSFVNRLPLSAHKNKQEKKWAPIQPQLFAVTVVMSQLVSLSVDETTYEASPSHSQRYEGTVYVCVGLGGGRSVRSVCKNLIEDFF